MDSRPDTYKHIQAVQNNMLLAIQNLQQRSAKHDQSKLVSPEVEYYDEVTEKLRGLSYGSKEYMDNLKSIEPALQHHYANNDHHPQHWPNGIKDMSLLSLLELICDWKAASTRHNDGNIVKSIQLNQDRFGYSDEIKNILMNTVKELGLC